MADTKKKKRASLSSFTILLIILVVLAVVTVIMAACGVEGIEGATLSGVLTAPVFGFQDAIGVCLFVMILGGFLGIITETGALDAGIAALVHKLKGNELVLIPIFSPSAAPPTACARKPCPSTCCSPPPWWPPASTA